MPPGMQREVLQHNATIAAGASVSNAIDLTGLVILSIQMPAAWTAAAITFQASYDGASFGDVYDDGGTEVTIASANVVASRVIVNAGILEKLAGCRFIKLRSGTTGTPVNQGVAAVIRVTGKA